MSRQLINDYRAYLDRLRQVSGGWRNVYARGLQARRGDSFKPKLKSNPETGMIVIDEGTQLTDVPVAAWEYCLCKRSAINWVLDQHKEKTP